MEFFFQGRFSFVIEFFIEFCIVWKGKLKIFGYVLIKYVFCWLRLNFLFYLCIIRYFYRVQIVLICYNRKKKYLFLEYFVNFIYMFYNKVIFI